MPIGAPAQAPAGMAMMQGFCPPVMPPPAPGAPGYAAMSTIPSVGMPPSGASMPPMPNGFPVPRTANVFGSNPGAYLGNPSATVSASNGSPPASLPQTSATMSSHVYAAPPHP